MMITFLAILLGLTNQDNKKETKKKLKENYQKKKLKLLFGNVNL